MEIHKEIIIEKKFQPRTTNHIIYFTDALEFVKNYYSEDLERVSNVKFEALTPEFFFKEYIWCVYTSGFNAKIVSKLYPELLKIYEPLFGTFIKNANADSISIAMKAMEVCANKRKVKATIDMAFDEGKKINKLGWLIYKNTYLDTPQKLQSLPFIGNITCFHLARNIGLLDFVKPDLHLVRMAKYWKFSDPDALCSDIKKQFDLPLGIIDLVLWYAASTFGTKGLQ